MPRSRLRCLALGSVLLFANACSTSDGDGPGGGAGGGSASGGNSGGGTGGRGGNSPGSGGAAGASNPGTGGAVPGTGGRGGAGGGSAGAGGSVGAGGATGGSGGGGGRGGAVGSGGARGMDAGTPAEMGGNSPGMKGDPKFSFFYTSLAAMRRLSKSQNGFGGDLRFGMPTGLEGADKICQTIAGELGYDHKTWRAFLSVVRGPAGTPVNAIDRVGNGPWYDLLGRLIAMDKAGLIRGNRPAGDPQAVNDLPDESGLGTRRLGDTHDVITGSNAMGMLASTNPNDTCMDWTSATTRGRIQMGHSWPAGSGMHWIRAHLEPTCVAGVNLVQNGPGNGSSIGAGGGWGGYYCFAAQ